MLRKNKVKRWAILTATVFSLLGCYKNYTKYYSDAETPGVSIFSNKGNNILSCFIDGKPWRTIDRIKYEASQMVSYEVDVRKEITGSLLDTLVINWMGYYNENESTPGNLRLLIAVPKNFNYRNFSALQGQRLLIDTTNNGFFSTSITGLNTGNTKGNGSIYFHTALLDSIGPDKYIGNMSGLIEADFPSFKITKGRFDESLDGGNIAL